MNNAGARAGQIQNHLQPHRAQHSSRLSVGLGRQMRNPGFEDVAPIVARDKRMALVSPVNLLPAPSIVDR
jgi:hypothetical protein